MFKIEDNKDTFINIISKLIKQNQIDNQICEIFRGESTNENLYIIIDSLFFNSFCDTSIDIIDEFIHSDFTPESKIDEYNKIEELYFEVIKNEEQELLLEKQSIINELSREWNEESVKELFSDLSVDGLEIKQIDNNN